MASYSTTEPIAAPADVIWGAIRNFGDGSIFGVEFGLQGEGVGAVRSVSLGGDAVIKEVCERLDDDAMVLGYGIPEAPGMPFRDYHATMTVRPADGGSELEWAATFEPIDDAAAAEAVISGIYAAGVKALRARFES